MTFCRCALHFKSRVALAWGRVGREEFGSLCIRLKVKETNALVKPRLPKEQEIPCDNWKAGSVREAGQETSEVTDGLLRFPSVSSGCPGTTVLVGGGSWAPGLCDKAHSLYALERKEALKLVFQYSHFSQRPSAAVGNSTRKLAQVGDYYNLSYYNWEFTNSAVCSCNKESWNWETASMSNPAINIYKFL